MLKEMISWKGFDGKPATRTLYFNLTRYEIAHDMELEVLEQRFKRFQEDVIGDNPEPERDMTPPEIREMLDIFKVIIKHSYGVRSQDGKKFSKNEEIWNDFVDTGAFDAFIWYMFEDANRANAFMNGIWPEEVREAAAKVRAERPSVRLVEDANLQNISLDPEPNAFGEGVTVVTDDNIPSISQSLSEQAVSPDWQVMDKLEDYTDQQLLSIPDGEFEAIVKKFTEGRNVPFRLLIVGGKRMNLGEDGPSEG